MCGIAGALGTMDVGLLKKSVGNLFHRGPDKQKILSIGNVHLGHARLSIIDTSDSGDQPMVLDNRYFIVFNGEIYNYIEIRKELEKKGEVFTTQSDTEVLLVAYKVWGADCLCRFNGMWAFAIWDNVKQELFLTRDELGKKPLFYSFTNNVFCFASEMKGIYPFLDKIEVNEKIFNLACQNNVSYEHTEHCLIEGIKRFPAGSYAILKNGDTKLNIQQYWKPEQTINSVTVSSNYNDQVAQFRELFLDSVKIRMRADVKLGTALSGGLDSSSIACGMHHVSLSNPNYDIKDWRTAFCASFPGSNLDEVQYARAVAEHTGCELDIIEINPLNSLDKIFHEAYLFEEIYYAPTIPFMQLYGRMRQKGVKVTLDGHGADELFCGYWFDAFSGMIDALPNFSEFNTIYNTINESLDDKSIVSIPSKWNCLKFSLLNRYGFLSALSRNRKPIQKIEGLSFLNSSLFQSSFYTNLPTLLRNYDRYSMAHGVEVRMPFLDTRIINFAFSIPGSSKIRNGYFKAIIRDAVKDCVPEKILQRKSKIGFNSPMHFWLKGPMKQWVLDHIHTYEFEHASLFNGQQAKLKILAILNKGDYDFVDGRHVYEYMLPYIWQQSLKLAQQQNNNANIEMSQTV